MMLPSLLVAVSAALLGAMPAAGEPMAQGQLYRVDCGASASGTDLHSVGEVNSLHLEPGDVVSFKRGTVCSGSLHPRGDGITLTSFGEGELPRIEAGPNDEAALRLFNQQDIHVSSLEFRGGTTYGIYISADSGTMHDLTLGNLTVSKVRGSLRHKESGLVVIAPSSAEAGFEDVHLDGIRAFDTTQWSGIFLSGASQEHPLRSATVRNSIVHDVQGEGIVLFNAADSSIQRSVAWHTGLQHQESIGTPNGIWTWQCNRCLVEENEAFLTDSPGVDGGAFDIDWGNTENTVRRNFGHDTQGYCVAIFAANGPTRKSTVEGNVCINNGMSPRLAQRQGAILLMTWNGGSIAGLKLTGNRLEWTPSGDVPAIRSGESVTANHLRFDHNEIQTTTTALVDPALNYTGEHNRYLLRDATKQDIETVRSQLVHETDATVSLEGPQRERSARGWRLSADAIGDADVAALYVNLTTAAAEYLHAGLSVSLHADGKALQAARDWALGEVGVALNEGPARPGAGNMLELLSPEGRVVRAWKQAPAAIDLGLALRENLGLPNYGRLALEGTRAKD